MSRSALWRQDAGVKERERTAREVFESALAEGKNRPVKGLVAMVMKDDDSFNLHPMLLHSTCSSPYFLKLCQSINDWNALVDEIYYHVHHLEPWMTGSGSAAGREPSTAFCVLLRLLTLRSTEKQMHLMLHHVDSPYIRCIGFLYLRYVADPSTLFEWCKPFLFDPEPVLIQGPKSQRHCDSPSTVGEFVRFILQNMDFFGTIFPRLPVNVERDIKVKLLQAQQMDSRARQHLEHPRAMQYLQTVGNQVNALYQDEDNPLAWYKAVIDRVIPGEEESAPPTFVITFTEYGNTETVSLGELDLPDFFKSNSATARHYAHSSVDNHTCYQEEDLRNQVLRTERESVMAKGKQYASRPKTVKDSLASGQKSTINNTNSNHDHGDLHDLQHSSYKRARMTFNTTKTTTITTPPAATTTTTTSLGAVQKHKTAEDIAALEEKKRKLLVRYG